MSKASKKWLIVLTILLVGSFFRLYRLRTMPWGLSQDEVGNASISLGVLEDGGAPFLQGGYGHEPFFHYLQAGTITLFGDNAIGIRMAAVIVGTVFLSLLYVLVADLFGRFAAWVALAAAAISWWPIVFSRIGIRAISLPLVLTLGVICMWRGTKRRNLLLVLLSGGLLGLSVYTYTAARALPLLIVAWLGYGLAFKQRALLGRWRIVLMALLLMILAAAPFVVYLRMHPELDERVGQLRGPLEAFLRGNIVPLWRSVRATLGMFSFDGEGRWTYGIPGRAIFDLFSSILFYLGVGYSVVHVKRSAYGVMLLWLFVMLIPSMVTPEAPSTIRAIGALPAVYGLVGLGGGKIWAWVAGRKRIVRRIFVAVLCFSGTWHLSWTYRDGFVNWASHPEVYWRYKAHFADVAAYLDRQSEPQPAVIFQPWVTLIDVNTVRRNLIHDERQPRWVQGGRAFIWPTEAETFPLALPIFATSDPTIRNLFIDDSSVAYQSDYRMPDGRPGVTIYTIEREPMLSQFASRAGGNPAMLPESQRGTSYPLNFDDQLGFLGYDILSIDPSSMKVISLWEIQCDDLEPVALFVHLLDGENDLVAQHDGFDVWVDLLREGDVVAQLHSIALGDDVAPGKYRLQIGAYRRGDLQRLPVEIGANEVADRLWLTTVEVGP